MNVFQFMVQFRDGVKTLQLARSALIAVVGKEALAEDRPDVYVRLKDGTELPVRSIKVRGPDRIILETFVE